MGASTTWARQTPCRAERATRWSSRFLRTASCFDRHFILADEPYEMQRQGMHKGGMYGYPHTMLHDGYLYAIFSLRKEAVAALRVPLSEFVPTDEYFLKPRIVGKSVCLLKSITFRERVLRSIHHQPLDALPWQMDLTRGVEKGLKQYYQNDDLITAAGDHVVWVKPLLPPALADPTLEAGLVKGEFGDIWRMRDEMGNWGELVYSPIPEPTSKGLYHSRPRPGGALQPRAGAAGEISRSFLPGQPGRAVRARLESVRRVRALPVLCRL